MDDRNGECFEHHQDVYNAGPISTSDSEHECLKDFLFEPRDSVRDMPCSDRADNSLGHCLETQTTTQNDLGGEGVFENCTDMVNSCSEREDESEIPSKCRELINSQNSCSSIIETTNSENERNGTYLSPSLNNENLMNFSESLNVDKLRDSESSQFKEETERENSSDLSSVVQKDIDNDLRSTKGADRQVNVRNKLRVVSHQMKVQESPKSGSEGQDGEVENAHSSESSDTAKGRNSAPRGRKRKGVESTARGRPPGAAKKKKQPVTYQSQISPDQKGIKIRIKKSSASPSMVRPPRRRERGKKRKSKKGSNTEDEESDIGSNKQEKWKDPGVGEESEGDEFGEQSDWGVRLPRQALYDIFFMVTQEEGCLPFLIRMCRVCRLWRDVALSASLWYNIDLASPCIKDKYKTTETVRWLCENRLTRVQELNVGGWKFSPIEPVLDVISKCCQDLRGLNMTGWKGLNSEHLKFLIANCPLLSRLDLSSINPETNHTRSALSLFSISHLTQTMGDRLTHLILANNRLAAIPQLITAIATHCPNLQVLDLSNLRTVAHTTAPLHIEKLQEGCHKLRILRITNSQIALSTATLKEQVASPGFPALEELSVAGNAVDGFCSTPVMDDNAVERIVKSSHKLKLLDVRGCSRVSDSSLVRVPAWDLEHLFLSGCYVTRLTGSGLELIAQKWSHSLIEVDLAWSTATESLDLAVTALAEQGTESPLRVLNLCGSSVSLSPVKAVLLRCPLLVSLNLSSCRALPRGMKRLYEGSDVTELRSTFEEKPEADKDVTGPPEQEEMEAEKGVNGLLQILRKVEAKFTQLHS
ncbi:F-box/LRR-repeat protein 6 [Cryptotermes secundus]|uniref:F-box/LRR-repeat protein 6 n=1 Tax=Cryptotermes secundus TaxID=105785 RepID=A0A2J7QA06_9NEOP|nr:F-box/LRR-repeat protein 6 isoform X2 [Cryptotermes secundus]PNF25407.1 F-box/LRR-repeat protein 6 [Cryptotermes secundus]